MRKLILVPVLASLAACGSSGKSGGESTVPLSATIAGHTFSPTEVRAVTAATSTTPCTLAGYTLGVNALAIEVASYGNLCNDLPSLTCMSHKSAESALVLLALVNPLSPYTAPTITPGTEYTVHKVPTTIPTIAYGVSLASDATSCSATAVPTAEGGKLRIDSISATEITGFVDVQFSDGAQRTDTLRGNFTAKVCGALDVCNAAGQAAMSGVICGGAPAACLP